MVHIQQGSRQLKEQNPYSVTEVATDPSVNLPLARRFPLVLAFALMAYTGSAMNLYHIGLRATPPNGFVDRQLGLFLGVGSVLVWLKFFADRNRGRLPRDTVVTGLVVQVLSILVLVYLGYLAPPDLMVAAMLLVGGFSVLFWYYSYRDRWVVVDDLQVGE